MKAIKKHQKVIVFFVFFLLKKKQQEKAPLNQALLLFRVQTNFRITSINKKTKNRAYFKLTLPKTHAVKYKTLYRKPNKIVLSLSL